MICLTALVLFLASAAKLDAFCGRYTKSRVIAQMCTKAAVDEQLGLVSMYTKLSCPYCEKAKSLLENEYGLRIVFLDIEEPDRAKRERMIGQMTTFSGGRKTVPQIFFNAEHLGGYDDIQSLESEGKLAAKVAKVKSTPPSLMMDHWFHPWY